MDRTELDIGGARAAPRARPRRAALDALDRLLRAHAAMSEHRRPEGAYGLLRPAREDEVGLIEAVFLHCGVPLPGTLREVYRRTLGVGNPVSSIPVLAVPFLRAALPDEGYGCPVVGLAAFEEALGLHRSDAAERPPALALGHAAPVGLTASRNGLWSLEDCRARGAPPPAHEFDLAFEAAFCAFVDQVLLTWANDLAGNLVARRDLDLARGASLAAMPQAVHEAMAALAPPGTSTPRPRGDVQPLDNADLLRAARRGTGAALDGAADLYTAVVGLPYGERPEAAGRIGPGTLLRLRPVDDNPHDPDAVEVWHDGEEGPVRVGFVERRSAPGHRALPQGAAAWRLRVRGRSERVLYATLEAARPQDASNQADRSAGRRPPEQDGDLLLPLDGEPRSRTGGPS